MDLSRTWNDTPIHRRPEDGYLNASAMCKANGKLWADFWRTDRCTQYLEALSTVMGKPITGASGLVQSQRGGTSQGTWVHPDVATELARWISPSFSVFVNQWFREEYEARSAETPQAPEPKPALAPQATLDLIERGYNLLERFGVADDRDRLQFGDMVRNVAARAAGGALLLPQSAGDEELTITDAWLEVAGKVLPRGKAPAVGKLVAQLYREEFGAEPPTRQQYVDGAVRQVKSYRRNWLIGAIKQFVGIVEHD